MARPLLALVLGLTLLVAAVAVIGLVPTGDGDVEQATRTRPPAFAAGATPAPPLVREVLVGGLPPAAPGQALDLVRYTVAPGATLPVHVHPGMQAAWIASGELTYHVLLGEAPIGRAASAATPGPAEVLAAGETTVLRPGDWVVEAPGVVHYGENLGAEPVVILAATLFEADQPPAIPVNPEGTPVA